MHRLAAPTSEFMKIVQLFAERMTANDLPLRPGASEILESIRRWNLPTVFFGTVITLPILAHYHPQIAEQATSGLLVVCVRQQFDENTGLYTGDEIEDEPVATAIIGQFERAISTLEDISRIRYSLAAAVRSVGDERLLNENTLVVTGSVKLMVTAVTSGYHCLYMANSFDGQYYSPYGH